MLLTIFRGEKEQKNLAVWSAAYARWDGIGKFDLQTRRDGKILDILAHETKKIRIPNYRRGDDTVCT